jgi:hypothetical protein
VEQGAVADRIWLLREGDAAIANRLVEVLDGLETAIGERLVNEHPKMLGRLQFGAVGGLKDEVNSIGDSQVLRALPAEAGKKESMDHRLNQACQPSATPSSRSSLDCHLSDARTAEDGSAQSRCVNESAKVMLVAHHCNGFQRRKTHFSV